LKTELEQNIQRIEKQKTDQFAQFRLNEERQKIKFEEVKKENDKIESKWKVKYDLCFTDSEQNSLELNLAREQKRQAEDDAFKK
jgi:hypothetical protein